MTGVHRHAVFGRPVAHSLSPRIHAAFGAQFGMAIDYRAIDAGCEDFPAALAAFEQAAGQGANLTLPLKQAASTLCVSLAGRARRCGSVNTLLRVAGGWHGDSTDGAGLVRDLAARHGFSPEGRRVLLLGAGGAARAVAFALVDADVAHLAIVNRTHARAADLAGELGVRARAVEPADLAVDGGFDLVIHATAAGHAGAAPRLGDGLFAPDALAYDLSYGNAARPFLAAAHAAGASRVSDGLGMLVEQAAESFALWHGRWPATAPVLQASRVALGRAP